jgi:hypothetical protein
MNYNPPLSVTSGGRWRRVFFEKIRGEKLEERIGETSG